MIEVLLYNNVVR